MANHIRSSDPSEDELDDVLRQIDAKKEEVRALEQDIESLREKQQRIWSRVMQARANHPTKALAA